MKLLSVAIVLVPSISAADRPLDDPSKDLTTVRSQVGWGATVNPDRIGVTTEGGWNGAERRAVVAATLEATPLPALVPGASIFASTTYGGVNDHARPAIGAAYQLIDPRTGNYSARISLAYKPEGFNEPEGEIESVLVGSRQFGADALRGMVAYGQDADHREADAELGASYVHRASEHFVVGGTARYRRGLKSKPGANEPLWDAVAGAIAGGVWGRTRVELLVGDDTVSFTAGTAQSGILGLLSIGSEM
jgi:hypothetical protein